MTKFEIIDAVHEYLAYFMNCKASDFTQNSTIFTVSQCKKPFVKIIICGNAVVVSTSSELHDKTVNLLQRKTKDELFECPLVYGQTIHYVPDPALAFDPKLPSQYTYTLLQDKDIYTLSHITGFDNSLVFDEKGKTNSAIAFVAYKNDTVIAIAGASPAHNNLWEVGIDVTPPYRNSGLATAMTQKLTYEIIQRGIVPFYSASITNIGSQMVASRAGYIPCWVDSWGNIFDDYYPYNIEI